MKKTEKLTLAGAVLCLLAAIPPLALRIDLNSDTLFFDSLLNDLAHGGQWSHWRLAPAPGYVPDLLLYWLGAQFLPTAPLRLFFLTVCQVLLMAGVSVWLARRIKPEVSGTSQALIILTAAACAIVSAHTGEIGMFSYANNAHFSVLFFSLLLLGLFLGFLRQRSWPRALAIIALGGIASTSSMAFVLAFVVPFLMCLLVLHFFINRRKSSPTFVSTLMLSVIVLVASQVLSRVLHGQLSFNQPLKGRISFGVRAARQAFGNFLENTANLFDFHNPWAFALALVVLAASVVALAAAFHAALGFVTGKVPDTETVFDQGGKFRGGWFVALLFLLLAAPVTVLGSILSGGFRDIFGYRYFLAFLALSMILCFLHLESQPRLAQLHSRLGGVALLLVALAAGLNAWSLRERAGRHSLEALAAHGATDRPQFALAACLARIEEQGFHLQSGIGNYWNSAGLSYHMRGKNHILALDNSFAPFFWMSTLGPMLEPEPYRVGRYNFAVLEMGAGPMQFGFSRQTLGAALPGGYHAHPCPEGGAEILTYHGGELDSAARQATAKFLARLAAEQKPKRAQAATPAASLPASGGGQADR